MASLGLDVALGVSSATTTSAWSSILEWSTLILRMLLVFLLQQPHRPCFHGGMISVDTYITCMPDYSAISLR